MADQANQATLDDPQTLSLAGALWLISAIIAARRSQRDDAWERLDRAQRLANRLGQDGNYAWPASDRRMSPFTGCR
jgi:hypothetical protein